ncbi:MAG: hypothetical protein BMS9Abin18_0791 [Zetaproteobacteria bacterium]|nr:MAG: hypothetical protein BMS9Abin18_0791 [Zetaproteobacteria bacterium]
MRTGLKLLFIIAFCELLIMMLFQWLDIPSVTSPWVEAITDPVLLALLAAYPVYRLIVRPLALLTTDAQSGLRKMARAVDASAAGIMITNASGIIEYSNPAFTNITGYSAGELAGNTPAILKSGEQDETFYQHFWQTISSGVPWSGRIVDKAKDGHAYPVRLTVSPITNDEGKISHYVAMHEDVSEQETLHKQLMQAQKMEAMGTLVAGIAHDFNNVLAGIMGNCYLAEVKAGDPHQVSEKLDRIRKQSQQAAGLIRRLLIFAHHEAIQMQPLSLASLIRESLKLQRASVPENVELKTDIASTPMEVHGDSIQLQQVLLNLIGNAVHALQGRPNPFIRVGLTDVDRSGLPSVFRSKSKAVRFAHLFVEDNGNGIAKEHREKLFEPFFTTKERGKGIGLGLAMAYGAVQAHDGFIEVESEEGIGTVLHVYLPLLETQESMKCNMRKDEKIPRGQGETILLADDNPHVLESTHEMLESMGYHVITACNGEEATRWFENNQNTVDALLLDVRMPHKSGVEVAALARNMRPDIPVILVTSHDEEDALGKVADFERCMVLSKPYTPEQIGVYLRRLIEAQITDTDQSPADLKSKSPLNRVTETGHE